MKNFSSTLEKSKTEINQLQNVIGKKVIGLKEPEKKVAIDLSNHTSGFWPSSKNVSQ